MLGIMYPTGSLNDVKKCLKIPKKGVIRNHKSKNGKQYNGKRKRYKRTNNYL